jgi:phosphatidate cytidylyltransferase
MKEIAIRALTGAAYVALTVGAALAGPITTTLLFLPVCLIGAREMLRLVPAHGPSTTRPALLVVLAGAVYLAFAAAGAGMVTLPWATATLVAAVVAGTCTILAEPNEQSVGQLGLLLILLAFIALPFGLITFLLQDGPSLFLGFMIMLWTNDTGAYLVGRALGRTKLLPRVSPKKTVEGLIGGIVLAAVAGAVLSIFWPVLSRLEWMLCAVVVAIAATLGDLLESAWKRGAGCKDSGNILPGHGGILDRFDGFLLALPAMLACVKCLGH